MNEEFEFTLPVGYLDKDGTLYKKGVMRLATPRDEILPLKSPQAQKDPEYLRRLILAGVILSFDPYLPSNIELLEKLPQEDIDFLEEFYTKINSISD